jgi:inosine-uridine nucleoside N-ribohydrolase
MKVIIDTDCGVDDALALAFLARSPEIDLLAALATFGNNQTFNTARNTRYVLDAFGKQDVPVYSGARAPFVRDYEHETSVHGETGLGYHTSPDEAAGRIQPGFAPSALLRILREADDQVTLLPVGPLTNIALALIEDADTMRAKVDRLVLMGGSTARGNMTPAAEANFWHDPEAASIVMKSGIPITMVGLDVTEKMKVPRSYVERLEGSEATAKEILGDALRFYSDFQLQASGFDGFVFHDALAAALLVRPDLCTLVPYHVEISLDFVATRGESLCDASGRFGEPNVDVAVDVDVNEALQFILGRVAPEVDVATDLADLAA